MRIIAFVGMPASGKGEAAVIAKDMGYMVVNMGDVIREEVQRLGLAITDKNLGMTGTKLRQEEGPAAIAQRCIPGLKNINDDTAIVDGVRNIEEVYLFKKEFKDDFILINISSSSENRHDTDLYTAVCALDDPVLKDAALLVMGAGSHLRAEIAVSRALTEAAQSRVVQIHGAREDTDRESMVRTFGYDTMKRLNKYWYEDSEDKVRLSDLEDKSADTPAKNIETIITMLRGIVPYAVIIDLSRSNVKMPVIRAVLPTFELYTLDRDRRGKRMKVGRNKKMSKKKFRRPRPS